MGNPFSERLKLLADLTVWRRSPPLSSKWSKTMAALFPGQGETGHGGPHPSGQKSYVEIAEWSRPSAGRYRGALEQILEITIIVVTQPAYADALPVANQLASHIAVLAAVVGFDCECCTPTVVAWYENGVAFAEEPPAMQHGSDRSREPGAITSRQDACGSPSRNRGALLDAKLASYPVAGRTVRPAGELRVRKLGQPLAAMPRRIHGGATAGNRPAAIQRFNPTHHSREIFGDGQIAAT